MTKAIEHFASQIAGIHCGVATPSLVDTIKVEYQGQLTPIAHLAVTSSDHNRIAVIPYDPSMLKEVETVLKSNGFNAYVFNKTTVVVPLPKFATSADQERAIAQVRKLEEEAKVSIRNIRKKERKKLGLPENEQRIAEKKLQDLTDASVSRITELADNKVRALT